MVSTKINRSKILNTNNTFYQWYFTVLSRMEEKIAQLEAEVARLKGLLGEAPRRAKISQMSSEVKDSNPYSRLMGKL